MTGTASQARSTGRSNKYGGRCDTCSRWVEPEGGWLLVDDTTGRFQVRFRPCESREREARWGWERRYSYAPPPPPPPPRPDLPPGFWEDAVIRERLAELKAIAATPPCLKALGLRLPTTAS